MAKAQQARVVDLPPARAFALWTDISRWRTFVDGFAHAERVDAEWPAAGAKIVWQSVPTGRGTVTEKVRESVPGTRFRTEVLEQRLVGTQTVEFEPDESGGTKVVLSLDYRLASDNPLNRLVDLIFIRRAQRDALARTLRRFATEAAEEAAL
jgi:ribosome-associated toxin RatA of RatAB toxin-antitoxin module